MCTLHTRFSTVLNATQTPAYAWLLIGEWAGFEAVTEAGQTRTIEEGFISPTIYNNNNNKKPKWISFQFIFQ